MRSRLMAFITKPETRLNAVAETFQRRPPARHGATRERDLIGVDSLVRSAGLRALTIFVFLIGRPLREGTCHSASCEGPGRQVCDAFSAYGFAASTTMFYAQNRACYVYRIRRRTDSDRGVRQGADLKGSAMVASEIEGHPTALAADPQTSFGSSSA